MLQRPSTAPVIKMPSMKHRLEIFKLTGKAIPSSFTFQDTNYVIQSFLASSQNSPPIFDTIPFVALPHIEHYKVHWVKWKGTIFELVTLSAEARRAAMAKLLNVTEEMTPEVCKAMNDRTDEIDPEAFKEAVMEGIISAGILGRLEAGGHLTSTLSINPDEALEKELQEEEQDEEGWVTTSSSSSGGSDEELKAMMNSDDVPEWFQDFLPIPPPPPPTRQELDFKRLLFRLRDKVGVFNPDIDPITGGLSHKAIQEAIEEANPLPIYMKPFRSHPDYFNYIERTPSPEPKGQTSGGGEAPKGM